MEAVGAVILFLIVGVIALFYINIFAKVFRGALDRKGQISGGVLGLVVLALYHSGSLTEVKPEVTDLSLYTSFIIGFVIAAYVRGSTLVKEFKVNEKVEKAAQEQLEIEKRVKELKEKELQNN
jgi:hypothetical protein